jgi:hypothetical protein
MIMTKAGKKVVESVYGALAKYSYFYGISTLVQSINQPSREKCSGRTPNGKRGDSPI